MDGAAAGVLPVLFFTAGLAACFLVCFFTLAVGAAGVEPLAGGLAGVCAANVRGMVAKARAIVIKVVFIFFSCGLLPPAHNPIMRPIRSKHDSRRRLIRAPNSGLKWLSFLRLPGRMPSRVRLCLTLTLRQA